MKRTPRQQVQVIVVVFVGASKDVHLSMDGRFSTGTPLQAHLVAIFDHSPMHPAHRRRRSRDSGLAPACGLCVVVNQEQRVSQAQRNLC